MRFLEFLREIYVLEQPADIRLWHRWNRFVWPTRLITGDVGFGVLERRWIGDRFEYREPQETADEWDARQW